MKLQHGNQGLRLVRQLRTNSDDKGLIPLINVIFLILIFFMIVGHMEAAAPFRVEPPVSRSDVQPVQDELTLLLAADGHIAVGGEALSLDTLEPWLRRRAQSAKGVAGGSQPAVSLKADRNVRSWELRLLLDILRRTGFRKVMLMTDLAR